MNANELLSHPAVSFWLKEAILKSLARDPVDALNDAHVLVEVLKDHLAKVEGR